MASRLGMNQNHQAAAAGPRPDSALAENICVDHRSHPVPPALASIVSGIWSFRCRGLAGEQITFLPKRHGFITVCLEDVPRIAFDGADGVVPAEVTVNGLIEAKTMTLRLPERFSVVGLELSPLGLAMLTGVDANEFTNDHVDAAALFGDRWLEQLLTEALEADFALTPTDAVRSVTDALQRMVVARSERVGGSMGGTAAAGDTTGLIAETIAEIERCRGRAPLAGLAARAGYSTRTLQRRFRQSVGVGIRTWSSRWLFTEMCRSRTVEQWQSVERAAYELGFCDASHMRRFVADHTGHSASQIFTLLDDERSRRHAALLNYEHYASADEG